MVVSCPFVLLLRFSGLLDFLWCDDTLIFDCRDLFSIGLLDEASCRDERTEEF